MGKCLFMRKGEIHTAPKKPGIALADIAVGSLVKLNENGSPVEFYVAKHDYESGLNGAGRTLLVRKDCCADKQKWHNSNVNAYATSDIDSWLNGTYNGLLDEIAQTAIGETAFYYTPGGGTSVSLTTVSTLKRSVFLLSAAEVGLSYTYANVEGTALTIASTLKDAGNLDGTLVTNWLRTPQKNGSTNVYYITVTSALASSVASGSTYCRPCFTLPATAIFDEETLEFKGVA